MSDLYPGITTIAAARMERIAGSYAALSADEQLTFTQQLRAARKKGGGVWAVKKGSSKNGEEIEASEESNGSGETQRESDQGLGDAQGELADQ